jgi:uncharacterized membrane protein YesL
MIDGVIAFFKALNHMRQQGYAYIWANLAFVVLALPLVTLPAAYSALMRVGHAAYTEPHQSDLGLMWDTFKENFWRSLPWGLAHLLFALVNFTNLFAFNEAPGLVAVMLRAIWIAAGFAWVGVLLYTWPIYYEMAQPSLPEATRNAIIMVLQNPLFTLTIVIGTVGLMLLSTVLIAAWAVLTWGAIASVGNAAVLSRLQAYYATQISKHGVN